jgi:hypothetical protein
LIVNISTATFHGFLINVDGSFLHRVHQFNQALGRIRQSILYERETSVTMNSGDNGRNDALRLDANPELIWGGEDDYMETLAKRHRHILTVALPWMATSVTTAEQTHSIPVTNMWNSLTDVSNVLMQRYYQWTGDNQLCAWIETPGVTHMKYDVIYERKCERNLSSAATYYRSLAPVFLYGKPFNQFQYWPNNGTSYPKHFYTDALPFVFYLHVYQDAVANEMGDVFSGHSAVMLYSCRDLSSEPHTALPANAESLPFYDEVLTLTQMWGTAIYHRMVEVVPRIAAFLDFVIEHPNIRIQAPGSGADRLNEIFRILGL